MLLKRLLLVFLVLLVGLSWFVAYLSADATEYEQMRRATAGLGEVFTLPVAPVLDDPDVVAPVLERAAIASGVNLFRTSVGYDESDRPYVRHFVWLASEETNFFSVFRLRSGRFLSPEETRSSRFSVSTDSSTDIVESVGVLDDIGRDDAVSILSLSAAYRSLPTAGNYVVEYRDQEQLDQFYEAQIEGFSQAGASLSRSDLFCGIHGDQAVSASGLRGGLAIWVGTIVVVVFSAYRQLYESKRTAVLLLRGDSALRAWFTSTGRTVMLALGCLTGVAVLAVGLVPGTTFGLAKVVAIQCSVVAVGTVVASGVTAVYARTIRIPEALKNRKDTRGLVVANLVIKCVLTLILIAMGAFAWAQYDAVRLAASRLGAWQQTAQYGILYPKSVGADLEELRSGQMASTAAEVYELYPFVVERGALFVDASAYTAVALSQPLPPGMYRSISVNPNFLAAYPVQDLEGNQIVIEEAEREWVVLVPETFSNDEEAIRRFFQTRRTGGESIHSVATYEEMTFGRPVPDAVLNQQVQIIWTAAQQRVFGFDPQVYPDDGNRVLDPIIQVVTLGNSVGIDRANAFSGDPGAGVKIPLIEGSTTKTLEALNPVLAQTHLDDNFRHLVTMNEQVFGELQRLQRALHTTMIQGAVVFGLFGLFAIQSVTLLFETDVRRVAVRKLKGYPFMSRHGRSFVVYAGVWAIQSAMVAALILIGARLGGLQASPMTYAATTAGFAILEVAICALVLASIEGKRIVNILKGEF